MVFGNVVTVSVDVGGDDRVLLVPRQHNTYSSGSLLSIERVRLAGRGARRVVDGASIARPSAAPSADEDGVPAGRLGPRQTRPRRRRASLASSNASTRAVVDEILELRGDDGRIRAFVRSIIGRRRTGRHGRLFART